MKKQIIIFSIALSIFYSSLVMAQTSQDLYNDQMRHVSSNNRTVTQDARSGNTYDTITNSDGSTSTVGTNQRDGTIWRSQNQPNGDQSGTDSNGNTWQRNR